MKDNFEDIIRDKMDDFEANPSPEILNNINFRPPSQSLAIAPLVKIGAMILGAGITLALVGFLILRLSLPKDAKIKKDRTPMEVVLFEPSYFSYDTTYIYDKETGEFMGWKVASDTGVQLIYINTWYVYKGNHRTDTHTLYTYLPWEDVKNYDWSEKAIFKDREMTNNNDLTALVDTYEPINFITPIIKSKSPFGNPEISYEEAVPAMIKDAVTKAKREDKLLFFNLYADNCDRCTKFNNTSLQDEQIKNFVAENFLKLDLNWDQLSPETKNWFWSYHQLEWGRPTNKPSPDPNIAFPFLLVVDPDERLVHLGLAPTQATILLDHLTTIIENYSQLRTTIITDHPTIKNIYPFSVFMDELTKARIENKIIMVYLSYSDNQQYLDLENITFQDPKVQQLFNEHFIWREINSREPSNDNRTLVNYILGKGGTTSNLPKFWFLDKNGQFLEEHQGYIPPEEFVEILQSMTTKK